MSIEFPYKYSSAALYIKILQKPIKGGVSNTTRHLAKITCHFQNQINTKKFVCTAFISKLHMYKNKKVFVMLKLT